MMSSNVVLAGLMGAGKSTVGPLVASQLGFEFVDTDSYIDEIHGPVAKIFARADADEEFRRLESLAVAEIAERSQLVIAVGGRTMSESRNRELLSRSGLIVCLDASDDELLERLRRPSSTFRPRLAAASDRAVLISELRRSSAPAMRGLPVVMTTGRRPVEVAEQIAETFRALHN